VGAADPPPLENAVKHTVAAPESARQARLSGKQIAPAADLAITPQPVSAIVVR